ncbi:MAG: hypothetical protein NTX50_11300 [Candidatus Sumerlaeota bacterium]|nr:hypothetical protein [Candidatus Sumerlaeota bacterium]
MDKNYVIARIDDWERRLSALHAQIEEWYQLLPPDPVQEIYSGSKLQLDEPLMRQYEVPPRMLPTRAIIYGRSRVSFAPGPLWIREANGQVFVTTSTHQFIVVDRGGDADQPSDWQIVTSQLRNSYRPFDQQVFDNLVQWQAIEAA